MGGIIKYDIWGTIILDCFSGIEESYEIVRRDGARDRRTAAIYFTDYNNFPDYEKKLLGSASGRCLDVGCGAGRVALYLQGVGLDVDAFDNSPLSVAVAKSRGVKNAVVATWQGYKTNYNYDTILLMGHNIGIAGKKHLVVNMLKHFYKLLNRKGKIIITSSNFTKSNDPRHIQWHKTCQQQGRYPGETELAFEYRNEKGVWFDWLLIDCSDLVGIAKEVNFIVQSIISTESGCNYGVVFKKK